MLRTILYCPTALVWCTNVTDRQTTGQRYTVGSICNAAQ